MQALLALSSRLDVGQATALSLVVNVLLFGMMIGLGELIARVWRARPVVSPPPPVSRVEIVLAIATILVNSAVMVAGWFLYTRGVLRIDGTGSVGRWLVDLVVLTIAMDLAMYVLHRLAHHPIAFRFVHGIHHRYDQPRPLTLFVLHPLEVAGFGGLWLVVLCTSTFSLGGMMLYLTVNSVFGTLGHSGVEPVPEAWAKLPVLGSLGTSTFHARHHQRPDGNFGFYTAIWDRLFRSLDPTYVSTFGRLPEVSASTNARSSSSV